MRNLIYNCGDKFKYYEGEIKKLHNNQVFVFGSNLAGRHGAGAAKKAKEDFGAVYGVGLGITGDCYAIPTKDQSLNTLSLFSIENYIFFFNQCCKNHPDFEFLVTKIGCGLAGYSDEQIAPLFLSSSENCVFSEDWRKYLE